MTALAGVQLILGICGAGLVLACVCVCIFCRGE